MYYRYKYVARFVKFLSAFFKYGLLGVANLRVPVLLSYKYKKICSASQDWQGPFYRNYIYISDIVIIIIFNILVSKIDFDWS